MTAIKPWTATREGFSQRARREGMGPVGKHCCWETSAGATANQQHSCLVP